MSVPVALVDTTFTGKNIATAVSVYEYTAAAAVTVRVQVRFAAVAGNGDYVLHLTLNDGDAQTDDAIGPRTTYAAASGETSFWVTSGNVDMLAGDVLNVFALGQAGDTSEAGSIRIFTDDYLQPTTAGRTLDVTATGEAGLDFANINAASAPTTLTNITVPTVTTVTTVSGLANGAITAAAIATGAIDADAIADNAIDAGAIAADAITAAKIATGAIDADALAADAGTELGTAVWASTTRTLTQAAASVTAAVAGSTITIARGDTLSATLTGLSSNTDYVSIIFTVKSDKADADTASILQIRKNASGSGDGLMYLNAAAPVAPVVAADGSITVNSSTSITIALAARATDDLVPADGLTYDVEYVFAASVTTATEGTCDISADVTRAIA